MLPIVNIVPLAFLGRSSILPNLADLDIYTDLAAGYVGIV